MREIEAVSGHREDLSVEYRYESNSDVDYLSDVYEWLQRAWKLSALPERVFCLEQMELTGFFLSDETSLHYQSGNGFDVSIYPQGRSYRVHYYEDNLRNTSEFYADTYPEIVRELADRDVIF